MTVALDCDACGTEVVFHIEGTEQQPTADCLECGQMYRLKAEKIY